MLAVPNVLQVPTKSWPIVRPCRYSMCRTAKELRVIIFQRPPSYHILALVYVSYALSMSCRPVTLFSACIP